MKYIKLFDNYSDKDIKRGDYTKGFSFGLDFKGDFRKKALIIKKLVRLKYKIEDDKLKKELDSILDMLEN